MVFSVPVPIFIKIGQRQIQIANPFQLMGMHEQESVLPLDEHTHHAYRLLLEYFCFPEKFNFLSLNLDFLCYLEEQSQFELLIHLKLNLNDQMVIRNYSELNVANFKLFATPVVNLFEKQAEPQKLITSSWNIHW